MKKILLLAIVAFTFNSAMAQAEEKEPAMKKEKTTVFTYVEQMPEFPGGQSELFKYISEHIKYPEDALEEGLESKVIVKFIITENGEVKDAKSMKPAGNGFDEEAIRVISEMPNWTPGKQNGKAVNVYFQVPVVFKIQKEVEEKE